MSAPAKRRVAVVTLASAAAPNGTKFHLRLDVIEAASRDEAEQEGHDRMMADHPTAKVLSVLVEPVPK